MKSSKIVCTVCNKTFQVRFTGEQFANFAFVWVDKEGNRRSGKKCITCIRALRQQYNVKTKYFAYKKYEKTHKGFLMRIYRNMLSRITGVQKHKAHLYKGKSLLPRERFYLWANNHPDFLGLFRTYKKSSFSRKLAPTVNRINSDLGYAINNMEWITHSENSRLGSLSQRDKPRAKVVNNSHTV